MVSIPLALTFGIVGIACDQRKLLAIITTLMAGALVLLYVCLIGAAIFCR